MPVRHQSIEGVGRPAVSFGQRFSSVDIDRGKLPTLDIVRQRPKIEGAWMWRSIVPIGRAVHSFEFLYITTYTAVVSAASGVTSFRASATPGWLRDFGKPAHLQSTRAP